jgi:hypothetical protein
MRIYVPQNEAQRRGLEAAQRRVVELRKAAELDDRHGPALVASLGENEGRLTPSSSPHIFWLAAVLEGRIS